MTQRNYSSSILKPRLVPLALLAPCLSVSILGAAPGQAQVETAAPTSGSSLAASPALQSAPAAVPDDSNSYIDSTKYSIGATPAEATAVSSGPPSVILSERSTGRQTVLKPGQSVPQRLYSSAPASGRTSTVPKGWISRAATHRRGSVSATRSQTGFQSKGTPAVRYASSSPMPVKVGPLALSRQGIRLKMASGKLKGFKFEGLTFPLAIPATITSAFGWRVHPITGDQRFHSGTDLGAPFGTPVLAAYAGQVVIADYLGGYGLSVILKHQEGKQETRYAHLSEALVQPGEWVEQGSVIGRVGSTGNSTGPHLHFELLQATPEGWVVTDPGEQLEHSLAQLVRVLQTAQVKPQPKS